MDHGDAAPALERFLKLSPGVRPAVGSQARGVLFGDLVAYLREHYGTIGWHPWKRPPYPTNLRNPDKERAVAVGGRSAMPKWGYGPQVK